MGLEVFLNVKELRCRSASLLSMDPTPEGGPKPTVPTPGLDPHRFQWVTDWRDFGMRTIGHLMRDGLFKALAGRWVVQPLGSQVLVPSPPDL